MTPQTMILELKKVLTALFADYQLKNEQGVLSPVSIYVHDLPRQSASAAKVSLAPYQILTLMDGSVQQNGDYLVHVSIGIVVRITANDQNGFTDVMNQIDRIVDRFTAVSSFGAYVVERPIDWMLELTETWPYSIGAVTLAVKCPKNETEDDLA